MGREEEGEGTQLQKLTLDAQAYQHLHHFNTVEKKQKQKTRSHSHAHIHPPTHHTDVKRGRVRVGLYTLANDYPHGLPTYPKGSTFGVSSTLSALVQVPRHQQRRDR